MPKQFTKKTYTLGESTEIAVAQRHEDAIDVNDSRIAKIEEVPQSTKTASYTLAASDMGSRLRTNVTTANEIIIPTNATVPIPVGASAEIYQAGTGLTTLTPATGVTLNSPIGKTGAVSLAGQFGTMLLIKDTAPDTWVAV